MKGDPDGRKLTNQEAWTNRFLNYKTVVFSTSLEDNNNLIFFPASKK
jgi:hypothetical protein